jgi:hypothetical protein
MEPTPISSRRDEEVEDAESLESSQQPVLSAVFLLKSILGESGIKSTKAFVPSTFSFKKEKKRKFRAFK